MFEEKLCYDLEIVYIWHISCTDFIFSSHGISSVDLVLSYFKKLEIFLAPLFALISEHWLKKIGDRILEASAAPVSVTCL